MLCAFPQNNCLVARCCEPGTDWKIVSRWPIDEMAKKHESCTRELDLVGRVQFSLRQRPSEKDIKDTYNVNRNVLAAVNTYTIKLSWASAGYMIHQLEYRVGVHEIPLPKRRLETIDCG